MLRAKSGFESIKYFQREPCISQARWLFGENIELIPGITETQMFFTNHFLYDDYMYHSIPRSVMEQKKDIVSN